MGVHVGSLLRPHCTPAVTNVTFIIILKLSKSSLVVKKAKKKIPYRFSALLYKSTRTENNFPAVFFALRPVKNTGHVLSKYCYIQGVRRKIPEISTKWPKSETSMN